MSYSKEYMDVCSTVVLEKLVLPPKKYRQMTIPKQLDEPAGIIFIRVAHNHSSFLYSHSSCVKNSHHTAHPSYPASLSLRCINNSPIRCCKCCYLYGDSVRLRDRDPESPGSSPVAAGPLFIEIFTSLKFL